MLAALAVFIGAGLGALLRWALALWLNGSGPVPLGTLAANLLGGYLVGLAVGVFQAMPELDPAWRLLLVTGLLGGLTTFSTFSAEVVAHLMQGRAGWALTQAGLHLMGSLALTWLGILSAQNLTAR